MSQQSQGQNKLTLLNLPSSSLHIPTLNHGSLRHFPLQDHSAGALHGLSALLWS